MSATEPAKSHSLAPVAEVDSNGMFSLFHPLHGCIRDHLDRQSQMRGQRLLAIQNNVDDVITSNYSLHHKTSQKSGGIASISAPSLRVFQSARRSELITPASLFNSVKIPLVEEGPERSQ